MFCEALCQDVVSFISRTCWNPSGCIDLIMALNAFLMTKLALLLNKWGKKYTLLKPLGNETCLKRAKSNPAEVLGSSRNYRLSGILMVDADACSCCSMSYLNWKIFKAEPGIWFPYTLKQFLNWPAYCPGSHLLLGNNSSVSSTLFTLRQTSDLLCLEIGREFVFSGIRVRLMNLPVQTCHLFQFL